MPREMHVLKFRATAAHPAEVISDTNPVLSECHAKNRRVFGGFMASTQGRIAEDLDVHYDSITVKH